MAIDKELEITNIIENRIFTIRGQKIMIDRDLAELYGVPIHRLNEAVKRNIERFPEDFMFQLTDEEWKILRSQIAIFSKDSRKYKPYAFTEHGVLMLSNVLNSPRAVSVSIQIIRVFNSLRKYALEQTAKDTRIEELKKLLMLHIDNCDNKFTEYDDAISYIMRVLDNLIEKPPTTRRIGFTTN